MTSFVRVGLILTGAIVGSVTLTACHGDVSGGDPGYTRQATLGCDNSINAMFKPDTNTAVLLVKAFKAGDRLVLSEAPSATAPVATKDVCVVKLTVGPGNPGPVDAPSTSPGIGIEVWLPVSQNWNGRIHIKGNGGWAGGLAGSVAALAGTTGGTASSVAEAAMNEGAVSSTTDTGHANTENFGSFAMNPDGTINLALWRDFSERSIHELAVKTKELARVYYGRAASYTYWNGFSTGGRQGLKAAQIYPGDFDGILVGAPAINWTRFSTAHLTPQVIMEQDLKGVRITAAQQSLVSNAAINACDQVGGRHMGYLLDPNSCRYDPTNDRRVICASDGGSNADKSCVTREQADAFNKIWYGQTEDGSVPNPGDDNGTGVTLAPKQRWYGPTRGSNLSNLLPGPLPTSSSYLALELQNPAYARPSFVNATGNGADLWKTLNHTQLANAADRGLALQTAFSHIDTDNPDLSAFRDRGGKLLMYHGLADSLIKPGGSIYYYNRVVAQMGGLGPVQNFYRFYLVPGMFHGLVNGTANPNATPPLPTNAQLYEALTSWVEKGIVPDRLEVASAATEANPGQTTFPLCVYPLKSMYTVGDQTVATSYDCQ